MNGVDYYAQLLATGDRLARFREAIRRTVRQGDRVLDLGAGLGTYAFFAARAGAGRVWAVERDPVIHLAQSLARANGIGPEVAFIRADLADLSPPAQMDVVIFEDFPVCFMDRPTWELLGVVEDHWLAPGARCVPEAATLHLAPAGSPRLRETLFPLGERSRDWMGLDWQEVHDALKGAPRKYFAEPAELLGEPVPGRPLTVLPRPSAEDLALEAEWQVAAHARVDALLLWFSLSLGDAGQVSNAPGGDRRLWGQWALPVDPPLEVRPDQGLHARVERETVPDSATPGWLHWQVVCGREERRGHEFAGQLLGPEDLVRKPGEVHRSEDRDGV